MTVVIEGAERERERLLIEEGRWPHFPMLPVKRYKTGEAWPEVGLIFWTVSFAPVTVYLVNMMEVFMREPDPAHGGISLKGDPTIEYRDLDAFFDAGWRGD